MFKYRVDFVLNEIDKKTVIKETPKTVTYLRVSGRESIEKKETHFYQWFAYFDEAKNGLIERRQRRINRLKLALEREKVLLDNAKSLKDAVDD